MEPNFSGIYKRPNKRIDYIEDRPRLRIRPKEIIERNERTMCFCNYEMKLQWILPT